MLTHKLVFVIFTRSNNGREDNVFDFVYGMFDCECIRPQLTSNIRLLDPSAKRFLSPFMILHCYSYSEFLTNMFCGIFYSCTVVGVVGVGEQQLVRIYGLCFAGR